MIVKVCKIGKGQIFGE